MAESPFPSNAHRTIIKIDHILGHKTNLNKFKELKLYEVCPLAIMELNY